MTATATPTWTETEHPRVGDGTFTEKGQSAPEVSLDGIPENVFTKKYDTVKDKVAAFHEELETAVADLSDDQNWNDYLNVMSSFHRYSMYNQLLIHLQRPDATHVAGFRKWKELDRSVIKGQKGISILRPAIAKFDEKDSAGAPVIGPDGKPAKTQKVIGFSTTSVFDVAQTEGKPLPTSHDVLSETPPEGFIDDLEQSIRDAGFTVSYEPMPGAGSGYTSPHGNRVVVDEAMSAADRARTLAHERGHIALGHLDRMDEYHTGHNGARGAMEVEAESFAYVVCRNAGMSPSVAGTSSTYVAGWSRDDPNAVKKSAESVAKAVKSVLGETQFAARESERESTTEVAAEAA